MSKTYSDLMDEIERLRAENECLRTDVANAKGIFWESDRENDELCAQRDALLADIVDWWNELPSSLRQDIEGSGGEPGIIARVRTAIKEAGG